MNLLKYFHLVKLHSWFSWIVFPINFLRHFFIPRDLFTRTPKKMFKKVNGLKKEKLEKFHLRETKSVSSILENARMERRRVVLLAYVECLAALFFKKSYNYQNFSLPTSSPRRHGLLINCLDLVHHFKCFETISWMSANFLGERRFSQLCTSVRSTCLIANKFYIFTVT